MSDQFWTNVIRNLLSSSFRRLHNGGRVCSKCHLPFVADQEHRPCFASSGSTGCPPHDHPAPTVPPAMRDVAEELRSRLHSMSEPPKERGRRTLLHGDRAR